MFDAEVLECFCDLSSLGGCIVQIRDPPVPTQRLSEFFDQRRIPDEIGVGSDGRLQIGGRGHIQMVRPERQRLTAYKNSVGSAYAEDSLDILRSQDRSRYRPCYSSS